MVLIFIALFSLLLYIIIINHQFCIQKFQKVTIASNDFRAGHNYKIEK